MRSAWSPEGIRSDVSRISLFSYRLPLLFAPPRRPLCSSTFHPSTLLHRTTDRPADLSAQVYLTFAVTKTGAVRLSPVASFYTPERVQSEVVIKDEEVKSILARGLKAKKEKKEKVVAEAEA